MKNKFQRISSDKMSGDGSEAREIAVESECEDLLWYRWTKRRREHFLNPVSISLGSHDPDEGHESHLRDTNVEIR